MGRVRAGIFKMPNGKWEIDTNFSYQGKTKRVHVRGFKTEREAYAEKIRLHTLFKNGDLVDAETAPLAELVERYLEDYSSRVKASTAHNRRLRFNKYFIKAYPDYTVKTFIKVSNLRTFKKDLIATGIKAETVNRVLLWSNELIDFALDHNYITPEERRIAKLELRPVYEDKSVVYEPPSWSKSEFKAFLDTFDRYDPYNVLFNFLGHTGLRVGELRGLQVKHFNREDKTIKIEQQVTSKLGNNTWTITSVKSASSNRSIDLSPEIADMLVHYIDELELEENNFLFYHVDQDTRDAPLGEETLRRVLREHIKRAGVKSMSLHGFRHSNTTWMLSGELSPQEILLVSQRLGHKDKNITFNVYFHLHQKDSKNILKNLKI